MKSAAQIREIFLNFFEERGHRRVSSGSLVPEDDPTLLFTNAGMNQFKDVFLGTEKRDYRRAATSQKCMRVSGKHNDLETVGRTARHHTFFEMLGNFSFGDYFKREAIEFAWELCTDVYGLPGEQLYVTVFRDDDEALALWRDHMGIPGRRIYRLGEKDNFWAMGDTGPCGPCSELHYDTGTSPEGHTDCTLECECGRYVEIWNLVFMQFNRDGRGRTTPLPSPSIDTGMGLERIACVAQGVESNYSTDLFLPIIEEACRLTGLRYGEKEEHDVGLRILADHSRACAFLVNDGIVPGSEGRGYVMRKILRRAIRHGRMLGRDDPFIYTLTALVCELMKDAYPELETSRDYAAKIVRHEEEKFSSTLTHGTQLLDEICEDARKAGTETLPGERLFKLYDTYGFPLDLVREIAQERGLEVDESGFYAEMEKQRERARASWKGGRESVGAVYTELAERGLETEFTGYTDIAGVPGRVLALVRDEELVEELAEGETGELVLDRTPFYAEAGGQVADEGSIRGPHGHGAVEHVWSPVSGLRLHRIRIRQGRLRSGDEVSSNVLARQRSATARNHTATHLLHAALRVILGEHVKQAGSLVAPDRLRFDFSHYRPVNPRELREIEEVVNQKIRENLELTTSIRDLEEAVKQGAMALFGEKYSDRVRVVEIPGVSLELCGGTHVDRTGAVGVFKIVGEGSISAGVRRVEALTGEMAVARLLDDEAVLEGLSSRLRVKPEELPRAVERMDSELKDLRKQVEQLRLRVAQQEGGDVLKSTREIRGVKVLSRQVSDLDRKALRQLADRLRNQLQTGVVVLGTPANGKVSLVVMVSPDLTDRIRASDLIRRIAPLVGGGGGGRPDLAEAGGKDPSRLAEALEEAYRAVGELLAE